MPPIHLLIKPASGSCNMRCRYCFYTDEMSRRETASYGRMSLEVLEAVVRRALEYAEGSVTFAFQGGEPTLIGLDYYRRLVELCRQYNTKKLRIDLALQTNGLLIDEEWAEFLAKNRFLVGLSLDGPAEIHDANRVDAAGKGTHARVMAAARLMSRYGVEFNILTVVTSQTARSGRKVWSFFDKNGFTWRQCIPCLDPLDGAAAPWTLTADRYADFLKTTFDAWYAGFAAGKPVSERSFDNWVGMLAGRPPESCGMGGVCSRQYVLEADGSVYPCDFYVLDELRLGNLAQDSFETIEKKREELGFIAASQHIREECRSCRWGYLCRGGCRRHREPFADGLPGLNRFCEAYKQFFPYAIERMQRLAARLR
ncbi:MAG: anaerobic sulfatase maturase [Oscillospiraceae bacterium]|nr:anaerobic sulfatase maturase [Oscillospiraceae bacterium]